MNNKWAGVLVGVATALAIALALYLLCMYLRDAISAYSIMS